MDPLKPLLCSTHSKTSSGGNVVDSSTCVCSGISKITITHFVAAQVYERRTPEQTGCHYVNLPQQSRKKKDFLKLCSSVRWWIQTLCTHGLNKDWPSANKVIEPSSDKLGQRLK